MATKRAKPKAKSKKPAAKPAPRRTAGADASMSVVDGSMKPLIRAAFAKRLRG
jgi:hypothetical protein